MMVKAVESSRVARYDSRDFCLSPMVAFYEVTRACDLVCRHCRACAVSRRDPGELRTAVALRLIAELSRFPQPPTLVLTGGDPLKRPDLEDLVAEADERGLEVALTPSATPLVTEQALRNLSISGLSRLAISLDGACASTHDGMRGVPGSFQRSLEILATARRLGLSLQVNTTITAANFDEVDDIAVLLTTLGIDLWSVFFLVPIGRGTELQRLSPSQYEVVFERLWRQACQAPFRIKTTAAPHFRRYVLEQLSRERGDETQVAPPVARGPLGVNDGKGVMFISHTGVISPSGFLPLDCGVFPHDSVIKVYQNHPRFRALRLPNLLGGKCGVCRYRFVCGGSRARAFAVTGDDLAAEPDCVYLPEGWDSAISSSQSATEDLKEA